MARQSINYGTAYNDPADKARDAFKKCDDNFIELYAHKDYITWEYYEIGAWDMDTDGTKIVNWPNYSETVKVLSLQAFILHDVAGNGVQIPINFPNAGAGLPDGSIDLENGDFKLYRTEGGGFDNVGYDGSGNRGYILVGYIDEALLS